MKNQRIYAPLTFPNGSSFEQASRLARACGRLVTRHGWWRGPRLRVSGGRRGRWPGRPGARVRRAGTLSRSRPGRGRGVGTGWPRRAGWAGSGPGRRKATGSTRSWRAGVAGAGSLTVPRRGPDRAFPRSRPGVGARSSLPKRPSSGHDSFCVYSIGATGCFGFSSSLLITTRPPHSSQAALMLSVWQA